MAFTITLGHHKNPDVPGGYRDQPLDPGRPRKVPVASLADAVRAAEDYRDRNALGGGNWRQAVVRDAVGKVVATVSYNGRLWSPGGAPMDERGNVTGPVPSWAKGGAPW
ncbi:MAG TPA: hypothetical protein VFY71_12000 [Planctomycetota bacterium]|nr:hypothetical protein [Planctomycetota bacterium]